MRMSFELGAWYPPTRWGRARDERRNNVTSKLVIRVKFYFEDFVEPSGEHALPEVGLGRIFHGKKTLYIPRCRI